MEGDHKLSFSCNFENCRKTRKEQKGQKCKFRMRLRKNWEKLIIHLKLKNRKNYEKKIERVMKMKRRGRVLKESNGIKK